MKSIQLIGLVALVAILATGCATRPDSEVTLRQGSGMGMYSALDATAQVYSNPRSQAPVDDNPWRWLGFVLHPIGVGLDYAINRPIYAVTSVFPYVFGYTSEDVLVSSQRQ
ncbi:MAG TPA: hypothetical protein VGA17_09590 [Nitrospiraceae bacterium]|jgi:hypothetical protein